MHAIYTSWCHQVSLKKFIKQAFQQQALKFELIQFFTKKCHISLLVWHGIQQVTKASACFTHVEETPPAGDMDLVPGICLGNSHPYSRYVYIHSYSDTQLCPCGCMGGRQLFTRNGEQSMKCANRFLGKFSFEGAKAFDILNHKKNTWRTCTEV